MNVYAHRDFVRAPAMLAGAVVALACTPLFLAIHAVHAAHGGPGAKTELLAVYFLIEGVTLAIAAGIKGLLKKSVDSQAEALARKQAQRALKLAAIVWWLALGIELLLPVVLLFGFALSMGLSG